MMVKKKGLRYEWLLVLLLVIPAADGVANNGVRYFVSLGTSLSVGIQPDADGTNLRTDDGYADQLFDRIAHRFRKIRLVKLGCPGETSQTMIEGGICAYPKGSQLTEAVKFLRAHKEKVALVTLDMGVNDVLLAGCVVGTDVDQGCVLDAINQVVANLPVILTALREAAHPNTPIVGMNYYNPFLASWLAGADGQALAIVSAGLAEILNTFVLGPIYGDFGVPVADVAGAFQSNDFATLVPFPPPHGFVPINVALICQWTYMCASPPVGPNVHANPAGYGVIADAFADILPEF